jgi:hypothetical protein
MRRVAALACTLGLVVGVARSAKADDGPALDTRHESTLSPQNFALEVRAAIYSPQVDSDPVLNNSAKGSNQDPFNSTFGSQTRWEVGLELDWQAYRIPNVGSIGPGISLGYYNISALARLTNGGGLSGETTTLEILPMYLVGVFRLDVLWRQAHIPLVPYAKAGLGMALWRGSNTVGTSVSATGVIAEGHTWGTQFAVGLAFNIGVLDPNSVRQLDEATGINNTYLFAEYMAATLDGIAQNDPLRVGSDSFVFGVSFEF